MSQRRLLQSEGLTKDSSPEKKADYGLTFLIVFSLAAAWIAAGSTGLLSHPLRRVLTLSFLGIAILAPRPCPCRKNNSRLIMLVSACIAIYLTMSPLQTINILAVSLVLAGYSISSSGFTKRISLILSVSILIFTIYRIAYIGIPTIWIISDNISGILGNITKSVTNQPLLAGPTFAGIDFLILMSIFWILCLLEIPKSRTTKAFYGFAGIFAGHLCYLIALSYAPQLAHAVSEPTSEEIWSWAGLFHKAIPWNFPMLACVIQLFIASSMFRWIQWPIDKIPSKTESPLLLWHKKYLLWIAGAGLAILLPLNLALYPNQLTLQGKKIVFSEKGFLNWLKPEHGQYGRLSSGMYGMLPIFTESMGGISLISENLSQEDLSDADVLVLLFPDDPWEEGQLQRIWNFVKNGGSLLVMGEHTTCDSNGSNRFNEVLEPTNIQVEFDCATFTIGGWLQSYEPILHPTTAAIPDERNKFGVVIGASLNINWPARPLLIGRWGWSDMGDRGSGRAMMGDDIYNPGERLGDLVLAAEQPLGKGRIIAFGDTSGLTNGINVSSYVFTSRLFGYLAGHSNAHPMWKQISGILLFVLLIIFIFSNSSPLNVTLIILCLTISLSISNSITQKSGEILPDGRYKSPNNLAYVDSSHLEAYSGESWRPDGIGGFMLTLMRNDYIALSLAEFSRKHIELADLFISIAPSRSFSRKEQEAIKDFVMNGGDFIITAGMDDAGPCSSLLSQFGFTIGSPSTDKIEPTPFGYFKSPYLGLQDKQVFVRFNAAWPVYCNDPQAKVIAYGRDNVPVIIMRNFGKGNVVVIGDTCFAMNKNLEWEGGETFEGLRENADFWRWFISLLRDQDEQWIPPALQESSPPTNPIQEGTN
ncbi:MAG: hypothetical protein JXA96_07685 [Sedimentisphaerales bacterium]|nr:hypothetical protein [Sedimentisphaerales bacterium]